MAEMVDATLLLVAVAAHAALHAPILRKPMQPMTEPTDHTPIRRDVHRRDDGVVVVTEDDPKTGETVERKYPACPVVTTVKSRPGRR